MRKEIITEVEIPEKVDVSIENNVVIVRGPEGENKREFNLRDIELKKTGNKITLGNKQATKNEKKRINTIAAHITNMIKGVQKKFEYQLKSVFSHFPMTMEVKGNEMIIKNFLGEKTPRKCIIPKGAEVKLNREMVTITGTNKEIVGQASANIEKATNIRMRDRRIFQDGIFLISKDGEAI